MSMKIGVKGFVYADVLKDDVSGTTYGPVKQIPGLVSIENKTAANTETFYADDGPYETSTATGEISIDVEIADPSIEDLAHLLGHKITNGIVEYAGADVPPYVAVGFVGTKSNGKRRLVWLLKGCFQEPDDSYKTKGSKTEPQSQKLSGKFVLRTSDGKWKRVLDEDSTGVQPADIEGWFKPENLAVKKA